METSSSFIILELMKEVTGEEPKYKTSSHQDSGEYHYKYASGHKRDIILTGFSPRKQSLTLYITDGFEHYEMLLSQLGKHKTGKSCLYINKIADVDVDVLKELVSQSVAHMRRKTVAEFNPL